MFVTALRDFNYDTELQVKTGQVFELRNHQNDGLLLKHRHVAALDSQDPAMIAKLPRCGECGALFENDWQRDRCGREHESGALTAERQERRATHVVAPQSRAGQRLRLAGA